jgi:hypothetical protein
VAGENKQPAPDEYFPESDAESNQSCRPSPVRRILRSGTAFEAFPEEGICGYVNTKSEVVQRDKAAFPIGKAFLLAGKGMSYESRRNAFRQKNGQYIRQRHS